MTSIIYIGMDVHTTNFTLCAYDVKSDKLFGEVKIDPDYKLILKYLNNLKKKLGSEYDFICGYEAGCLGYSLYHDLTQNNVNCVILAPSTMANTEKKGLKQIKEMPEISVNVLLIIFTALFMFLQKQTLR